MTLLQLDVTSTADVAAAVEAVRQHCGNGKGKVAGRLDYLINNAGHNHFMPVLDEGAGHGCGCDEYLGVFECTVDGCVCVCAETRASLRAMGDE